MTPLLRAADKLRPLNQVRVRVIDDPNINAANAGGGEFQTTTGLLAKANDDQLRTENELTNQKRRHRWKP